MSFSAITDGWMLHHAGGDIPASFAAIPAHPIPATVPGVVHTDLLAAGLIPDPYVDDNEALLAWIGHNAWAYETTFTWSPDGETVHDLVAEGLDTVAHVTLNGVEIARTRNQHRTYRWRVDGILREGENRLRVEFASPIAYAREREAVLGERPHSYEHPFNAIRKSACNFGWDWGPALVTSGIWRLIGIDAWSGCRLAAVRPQTGVGGDPRRLRVEVEVQREAAGEVAVRAEVAGSVLEAVVAAEATSAVLEAVIPDAELWWPRGYGAPALSSLVVTAGPDRWEKRIGFRAVEIDTTPDDDGAPFVVRLNGRDVYVRGANWIPEDTFFSRITRERLAERFRDTTDAGMNLLRVWGGGIYESDDFYDLADENGILVWQDFLLACAAYSEDAELWDEFAAEARDNVTRLAPHASLVVWNGGNENIWGWVDWKWRPRLRGATWGEGYYQELFPGVVADLAPATPYSPGSPYGFSRYVHPNDPAHGTTHIWDVWNEVDYDVYRDYRPRFVSEFGFQGPPAWSTLFSVVHDEPADPYGPLMLVHQKAVDGNGKLERGLGSHIAAPRTIDDWHWATQLNQARAVAFGIAHFRSLHPLNQGAIVWQLNDCWPVISWAAVDSHGHRKPLWHALRAVFADRFASFQPREEGLVLALHDDHDDEWTGTVALRRLTLDGVERARVERPVRVAARSAALLEVPEEVRTTEDAAQEVLVAELPGGGRAFWFFAEDPALALDPEPVSVSVRAVDGCYEATAVARAVAKDVTLLVDRVHPAARVDRALVTLLPGESAVFRIDAPAGLDAEAFGRAPVLRSANDLVPVARPALR
ncbi:glycoside hydrolase family 2 protein [Microbacterium sp. KSW4-17]|uniref:beta-mannosidase n=1 Tax=Microbacterium galbum TaxID=3075994 RepID=A0ABU3T491_9MICO|nr:glycoside hydrolase family 2 protein [Microbacterium sp. KSW4-17]MDU0366193.1 glycoside hydrolase family 2 protein [Microbacterium sp. KSW4-17]